MAIHVQDEQTDWLVREFARRRGLGITAAIRTAVEEASRNERAGVDELLRRIEPILAEVRGKLKPLELSDKDFMDDMWGEND